MSIHWIDKYIDRIIYAGYRVKSGIAVADIHCGSYNPSENWPTWTSLPNPMQTDRGETQKLKDSFYPFGHTVSLHHFQVWQMSIDQSFEIRRQSHCESEHH